MRLRNIELSELEFDGFDTALTELVADAFLEHRFHLFELEAEGGLGDAEDEISAFHGNGLGVAGDEIPGELLPSGTHLIFVEAVFCTGGAEDGSDELFRQVDARIEVVWLLSTAPLPQDFLADLAGARRLFSHQQRRLALAVLADGFYRASFHGLTGLGDVLGGDRLFKNVRIALVLSAGEIVRRGLAAQVTVDALAVHVELASDVFHIFIFAVCHGK
jgi:hypothetical protein